MKKTINGLSILTIASVGFAYSALAFTPLTGQLDPGAKGSNVTHLQEFMASTPNIYPEGLVTGYYGSMTTRAVVRFQAANGLGQVGRVGPQTLVKINAMINNGGGQTSNFDTMAPMFYNVTSGRSNSSLTFSMNTSENTNVRVAYSTSPVMFNEGDINSTGFAVLSGSIAFSPNNLSSSHNVTINNLSSNTAYYVTLIATDASGNVSVYGTNTVYMSQ